MGKFYKLESQVYYFEDDQMHLVRPNMQLMSEVEVDKHKNPEKYMTAQQRADYKASNYRSATKLQLKLALLNEGKLADFETAIANIQDPFEKFKAEITYTDSNHFNRLDTFVVNTFTAIGLNTEQINEFWEKALAL